MLIGQDITVLGAGVAGLAAARALALRGASVRVLEQASEITEVGAGLQISPNGVRVLDALGLGEAARAAGMRAQAVVLADGLTGRQVLRMDLAKRRAGQAFLLLHRADLIELLRKGAMDAGVHIQTSAQVTAVEVHKDHGRYTLSDGTSQSTRFLVGADGLHSVLRQAINGRRDPFFTQHVAWRALVPAEGCAMRGEQGGDTIEARVHMGPKRHLVTYPLREGRLINIVAVEERTAWAEEGWTHRDDPENLRAAFAGFGSEVRELLARVETVHLWGLFRHPVANQWHKGAGVILGDAAHPTLPFMAQGAVMALEDAWVLADCLTVAGLEDGGALYQARRRHRVERVINAANGNARNYHHANPIARAIGHNALRVFGQIMPEQVIKRFDWIYDFDATNDA
ncbi:MAG: FAD-dependent monooxygenase [Maritimibacter sp.]